MKNTLRDLRYYAESMLFRFFIVIFRLMGVDRAASFGAFITKTLGPYLPVSNVARKNMQMALGYDKKQTEKSLIRLWENYGRYIGEFAFADALSKQELQNRIEIKGMHHIRDFQSQDQPFILMLAHLANWDFLIGHIDELFPRWAIIYRQANNKMVDKNILDMRKGSVVQMIPKGKEGVRKLLRAIKDKKAIAMLVDQKMNEGIDVPFFGKNAKTADAIAKLSLQYNYPIVPCQIIRKERAGKFVSEFEVVIHPPLSSVSKEAAPDKKVYDLMLKVNSMVEGWVLQNPSQWFWFHNRWNKEDNE